MSLGTPFNIGLIINYLTSTKGRVVWTSLPQLGLLLAELPKLKAGKEGQPVSCQ